ncbi:MAG: hypothetical protein AMXMBFR13_30700 [Phycisphaerae bacterium]
MENAALEWAAGNAKWFVAPEEIDQMSEAEQERYSDLVHRRDPASGLEIRWIITKDWRHRVYEATYRSVIEDKLREAGRSPPDFSQSSTSPSL